VILKIAPELLYEGRRKMELHLNRPKGILKIAHLFSWFTQLQMTTWILGEAGRLYWVEYWLPRLVREGSLKLTKLDKRNIYYVPKISQTENAYHGVGCTEALIRFTLCHPDAQVMTLKYFKKQKMGIVPDGGVYYPNGWITLFEFSTSDNAKRMNVMHWKANRYIEVAERNPKIQVVFILDRPEKKVVDVASNLEPHGALWYTDYLNFLSAPLREQLDAPLYINGLTGEKGALR
jgi:hypothetical protein